MAVLDVKNDRFIIDFKYDPDIISFLKTIPGHKWHPSNRYWSIPASRDNYQTIKQQMPLIGMFDKTKEWITNHIQTKQLNKFNASEFIDKYAVEDPDYTFKTKPYKHQLATTIYFKSWNTPGLFLDMGTGKSKIIIDIISRRTDLKKILYVCPNSVVETIKYEFDTHATREFNIVALTGPKQKRVKLLADEAYNMYILNYESVHTLYDVLVKSNFDAIILDESTAIKNHQAQVSKTLHKLADTVKFRAILTGTPITQSAIDIYSQFKFLDKYIFGPSYYAFKAKYAITGGFENKQIIGYRNLDDLHDKIYSTAVRFAKKDCLDLPEKIYEIKRFDLSDEEQKLYTDIKNQMLLEFNDKTITAQIALTKLIKFAQVTSGFVKYDDGTYLNIQSASKITLLKSVIQEVMPNKIIIWCTFKHSLQKISALLKDLGIEHVTFSGDTPAEDRKTIIDKFQTDDNIKVFIGNIRTGGIGITLTAASYVIYFNNTFSLQDRLQSEDRAHRIGQAKSVTYIDLVARKTVEESILRALKTKQKLSDCVIDNFKEILNGEF